MITYNDILSGHWRSIITTSELLFEACDTTDGVCVLIVPKAYWERYHSFLDEELNINHLVPSFLEEVMESCYFSLLSLEETKERMLKLGFVELTKTRQLN